MKQLHYSITIAAPKDLVWEKMLDADSFSEWTSAFAEGSYYEGSWDEGEDIRFLTPDGDGMLSRIAENRLYEFISIEHIGVIHNGVPDTESDKVKAWAPCYENYTFRELNEVTTVRVDMDVQPEYEVMFQEIWPRALKRLKMICED